MSRRQRNNGIALAILAVLSVLAFQRITNWMGADTPPPRLAPPPPLQRPYYRPEPPPLPRWEPAYGDPGNAPVLRREFEAYKQDEQERLERLFGERRP